MSSSAESDYAGSEPASSHSSDDHKNDIYPPGFPLSPATYEQNENAEDEADDDVDKTVYNEDRADYRKYTALFPYSFLDPNGVWDAPAGVDMGMPLAQVRHELMRKLAMSGHHVEFVPPWTDPDWSSRFTFTGQDLVDNDDPQYRMYAKEGMMQTQRPALREEDAFRNPTDAAKRWGIDPNHVDIPQYGNSAATPMQANFNVPLQNPRVTPSNQGVRDVVDKDDYDAVYAQYRGTVAARGGYASEDDFRRLLQSVAPGTINPDLGAGCDAQIANSLLRYMDSKDKMELQEEYQRLLFGGNTANELIETGVWTMDKTASTDLVTPIHDLLTRDKWEVTSKSGRGVPLDNGDLPKDSRKVYNFPNQKGEYCAANDLLWLALQPALQLATKILDCNHPATWAWADIYKMRACRDSRIAHGMVQNVLDEHKDAGVDRKDYFAVYLDEDESEFFPEQKRLHDMGFQSVYWVCEILKKCLRFEIGARYDEASGQSIDQQQMAWTTLEYDTIHTRPFNVRIMIAADYIWPLLIDDYSQAEKAVCSFTLASTITHELCHAIVFTRDQLFHPERIWLRLNSGWADQIGEAALNDLKIFGYRQIWDETTFGLQKLVMVTADHNHNFFADETDCEEGWATENQYWGGAPVHINKGSFLPETRFTDELVTMCAFDAWPGNLSLRVYKVIPFTMVARFFTQNFWDYDLEKWGHEAMKIWPLTSPRAFSNSTVFTWRLVQLRFGMAAMTWLRGVDRRLKNDYEHAILWAWLRELTQLAVEPKMCMIRWHKQQADWKATDKSLWTLRNKCSDKADQVMAYLQQLFDEAYSGQPMPDPAPPIIHAYFRDAFAALSAMHRALSEEASTYQLITVDYHRQIDAQTKSDIHSFYAKRLRSRLDAIHLRIAADCIAFLDMFTGVNPMVLLRIAQSDPAVQLLDTGRLELREKFIAVQHAFRPVRLTFSSNRQAYVFNIQDFANVTPISAQDNAKRIERQAKKQLKTLTGPLLKIAQGWAQILEHGERLKSAAAGSVGAEINRKLSAASNLVDEVMKKQKAAAEAQFPSAAAMYTTLSHPSMSNLLQQNQNDADPTMRQERFDMAPPQQGQGQINSWQTVYAEASGFVPYRDPRTGFTRFHRANIPTEAGPSVNPMAAAQAQAQGQSLVGAFAPGGNVQAAPGGQMQGQADPDANFRGLMQGLALRPAPQQVPGAQPGYGGQPGYGSQFAPNALGAMAALIGERGRQLEENPALAGQVVPSIYNRALQTVAGPNGAALINSNVPGADNLFGWSAAQSSMAQQQVEGLIRQQALGPDPYATLGNMAAQGPGWGAAPPSQPYEAVGGSAFQAFPPPGPQFQQPQFQQPQFQQQGVPPQVPFQPQGGFPPFLRPGDPQQGVPPQGPYQPQGGLLPPNFYPPGNFQIPGGAPPQGPVQPQGGLVPPNFYPPGNFQVPGGAPPQGPGDPGAPQVPPNFYPPGNFQVPWPPQPPPGP